MKKRDEFLYLLVYREKEALSFVVNIERVGLQRRDEGRNIITLKSRINRQLENILF